MRNRCLCDVRPIPFPTVDSMTYWVTEKGDAFGCNKMRTMCVTRPLKIERRYKRGCNIRYSIYGGKQKEAYMQNVMWSAFVSKEWLPDLEFSFKDGNQYNFALSNIEPKKTKANQTLLDNIRLFAVEYERYFNKVVNHLHWVSSDIPYDDIKDIASETFLYLCGFRSYASDDNFAKIWTRTAEKRCVDWWRKYQCGKEGLFHEDSQEEKYSVPEHRVEVADIWRHLRGEKCKKTMQLYSEGLTPTEIAKEMGSSIGTVGSCITRTIQNLREIYSADITK